MAPSAVTPTTPEISTGTTTQAFVTSRVIGMAVGAILVLVTFVPEALEHVLSLPDAVVAGTVCMDTYEASVWRVLNPATTNKGLVKKIQQGKATLADLAKGGATQLGVSSDDYAPCVDSGQNCTDDIYAVSLPGVTP